MTGIPLFWRTTCGCVTSESMHLKLPMAISRRNRMDMQQKSLTQHWSFVKKSVSNMIESASTDTTGSLPMFFKKKVFLLMQSWFVRVTPTICPRGKISNTAICCWEPSETQCRPSEGFGGTGRKLSLGTPAVARPSGFILRRAHMQKKSKSKTGFIL